MPLRSPVDAQDADDDLFRPTLSASDDDAGMRRPWDPMSLWITTFLAGANGWTFGVLGGALLFGLNGARLGRRRQGIALGIGMSLAAAAATVGEFVLHRRELDYRYIREIWIILLGLVGWLSQRARFRMFVVRGGDPAGALLPGLITIAVGVAAYRGFLYLLGKLVADQ